MKLEVESLRLYLSDANQEGYSAGNERAWIKEEDGSTTILHQSKDGKWKTRDNFFGGEPFSGITVVHYNNIPVWTMTYYGTVDPLSTNINRIYEFLRKALSHLPENCPLRGPEEFQDGNFTYKNAWEGNLENYKGTEVILEKDKQVFTTDYRGGWVGVREGV